MTQLSDTSPEAEQVLREVYRRMPLERKWRQLGAIFATAEVLQTLGRQARPADQERQPGMINPTENLRVVQEVIAVLDRLGIPYALGGSWASSLLGKMRFTHNADLAVEPFPGREADFCASFGEDYYISLPAVQQAVRQRSSFNLIHTTSGFKVDLFVRRDRPFEQSLLARRRSFTLPDAGGQTIQCLSPEDVILTKLEWYRLRGETLQQQWLDVRGVMEVQAGQLDQAYLDHWAGVLGVSDLLARLRQESALLMGQTTGPSPNRGRLLILLTAVLWSTSGTFTKLLTEETPLDLNQPKIDPVLIAAARVFFAGLLLAPLLRPRDLTFRPAMVWMALSFAAMNTLFVSAMALGKSANAILLQYTAPMWVLLICVWFLGEPADRRGTISIVLGVIGIGIIIAGGWGNENPIVFWLGLGSGVTYAGVLIGLRVLRGESATWLTVINCLTGASAGAVLWLIQGQVALPSWPQVGVLMLFGIFQMGLPYVLMARALRTVSPQEAGALTLIEPLLNPLWAFLVSPATETVGWPTFLGGAIILGSLAYRYWPSRLARNP